jgi:hypothetical protein
LTDTSPNVPPLFATLGQSWRTAASAALDLVSHANTSDWTSNTSSRNHCNIHRDISAASPEVHRR